MGSFAGKWLYTERTMHATPRQACWVLFYRMNVCVYLVLKVNRARVIFRLHLVDKLPRHVYWKQIFNITLHIMTVDHRSSTITLLCSRLIAHNQCYDPGSRVPIIMATCHNLELIWNQFLLLWNNCQNNYCCFSCSTSSSSCIKYSSVFMKGFPFIITGQN